MVDAPGNKEILQKAKRCYCQRIQAIFENVMRFVFAIFTLTRKCLKVNIVQMCVVYAC